MGFNSYPEDSQSWGRGRLGAESGRWVRTDVCQDGSGSVCGRSQMTPGFPLECCQTIDGTARLGMGWIQHTAGRKNLGNPSNGSCHSLGVQVCHTGFASDAFNIQETATTLLQS